jgi:hypothetical protein
MMAVETAAYMETLDLADERRLSAASVIRLVHRKEAPIPSWWDGVLARLEELREEPIDSTVERPLNTADVYDALTFLDRVMREDTCPPWIGRLSSGGIELAWRHADVEAEAIFDRLSGDRELLVSVGDNEWDAPTDAGDSLFASVIDRLSNSYIEHAAEASASCA